MRHVLAVEHGPRQPRVFATVVGSLLVLSSLVASGTVAARLCAEPLDVSGTRSLPRVLSGIKARDEIAYPAHVLLGSILERVGCDPTATALQWLKAAAHARSDRDARHAAAGIASARGRAPAGTDFRVRLCSYVGKGFARPEQAPAAALADLSCDARP